MKTAASAAVFFAFVFSAVFLLRRGRQAVAKKNLRCM
jgi:hypothetical protein